MRSIVAACVVIVLATGPADAADYYVATSGSNSNPGTLAQPFQTIQQAANVAQAGDNVYVEGGTYRETVTVPHSGTSSAPINFQPYAGQQVTVTGLDLMSSGGWTNYSGSIYQASVSGGASQLFVNGQVMNEARFPDAGYNNPLRANYATVSSASAQAPPTNSTITSAALGNPANGTWNGARMSVTSGLLWDTYGATVASQTGNTLAFQWNMQSAGSNPSHDVASGNRFYLTGSLNALTTAKEYYYDSSASKLYLYAPGGVNPNNQTVEVRKRQYGFDIGYQSYINVSGFRLQAASVAIRGNYNQVQNCQILHPDAFYPQASYDDPNPTGIAPGILVFGQYNTIAHSEIGNTWGNGISLYNTGNVVNNNVIHDVDGYGSETAAVMTYYGNNTITNNTIYNTGRNAIQGWNMGDGVQNGLQNLQIAHNDISRFGYLTSDLDGIVMSNADASGTVIAYNKIHDGRTVGGLQVNAGVYLDNATSNVTAHHNLVTGVMYGLVNAGGGTNVNYYNNTVWASTHSMSGGYFGPITNSQVYNNIGPTNDWRGTDIQHDVVPSSDPFVNSAAGNYTLKSTSSAIDAGIVVPGITDGYTGSAPDAGAFESGVAPWTAGANWSTWLFSNQRAAPLTAAVTLTPANVRTTTGSLTVGRTGRGSSTNTRSFLKFDVSGVKSTIQSAVLRIYENTMPRLATGGVKIYAVTSSWDTTNVSYSQAVASTGTEFYDAANLDLYTDVDITSIVQGWINNPSSNYGLSLRNDAEGTSYSAKYFDGMYGVTAPQLIITPEPSGLAILASSVLAGIGILAWRKRFEYPGVRTIV